VIYPEHVVAMARELLKRKGSYDDIEDTNQRFLILADALEEIGAPARMLNHCRNPSGHGPVMNCELLEQILGDKYGNEPGVAP
jgi:hypothetical protein